MKIVLDNTLADQAASRLTQHDVHYFDKEWIDRAGLLDMVKDADILGFRWRFDFSLDRDFLSQCRNLKHVHKSGTGLENPQVMDLEALDDLGVVFTNNSGLNSDIVAEHAVMLTLLSLRPATQYQISQARQGRWDASIPVGVPASRGLAGKTVGIVGLGQIGTCIAIRMRAMNVGRILGYQRTPRFEQTAYAGVEWKSLDELLAQSDVIILVLPINASTEGLIDRRRIGLIRPEATIVNVGRGAVIDEMALYDALKDNRISAAALDVLSEEPSTSPIMTLPNVIVTPHTAGTALEMQALHIVTTVDVIAQSAAGRRPPRIANPAVLNSPHLRATWMKSDA